MLNFEQTTPFQRYLLAQIVTFIRSGKPTTEWPTLTHVAEDASNYFNELIRTSRISNEIQALKQLRCLSKSGKWGSIGFTLTVPEIVQIKAEEWFQSFNEKALG